jgi:PIN domain nuclease of toxin-antitoxin system
VKSSAIHAFDQNIGIKALCGQERHRDPAGRIIAATAIYHHQAKLDSADACIRKLKSIEVVW